MCVCANFQAKQTDLTFSAQISPKMDLGLLAIQKTIVEIRISILDIPYFDVFSPNLSKKGFRVRNWEKQCRNKNQHHRDTLCTNFQPNWTTLTFLAQIWPKMDLGSIIQKTNVGIIIEWISIIEHSSHLWLVFLFLISNKYTLAR